MANPANVKLLLHFNGNNGDTTTEDSSNFDHTVTLNGDCALSTSDPKFGSASLDFGGDRQVSDYAGIPDDPDFDLGSQDLTIDLWAKFAQTGRTETLTEKWSTSDQRSWSFFKHNSGNLQFFYSTDGSNNTGPFSFDLESAVDITQWHHYAVTRDGSTLRLFVDGTERDSADVTGVTFFNGSEELSVGGRTFNGFEGQIDEVRIVKGEAEWTSDFTPPTTEYSVGQAFNDLQIIYDNGFSVNDEVELTYDILFAVNNDLQIKYDHGFIVNNDLHLVYDLFAPVNNNLEVLYNLGQIVNNDVEIKYTISTPISNDLEIKYNRGFVVNNDTEIKYDLEAFVGRDLPIKYKLRGPVGSELVVKYHNGSLLSKDFKFVYGINPYADLEVKYNHGFTVSNDLEVKYSYPFINADLQVVYNHGFVVNGDLEVKYNQPFVNTDLELKYDIYRAVARQLPSHYNILQVTLSAINQDLEILYNINSVTPSKIVLSVKKEPQLALNKIKKNMNVDLLKRQLNLNTTNKNLDIDYKKKKSDLKVV